MFNGTTMGLRRDVFWWLYGGLEGPFGDDEGGLRGIKERGVVELAYESYYGGSW
jgi:hypothetical protein